MTPADISTLRAIARRLLERGAYGLELDELVSLAWLGWRRGEATYDPARGDRRAWLVQCAFWDALGEARTLARERRIAREVPGLPFELEARAVDRDAAIDAWDILRRLGGRDGRLLGLLYIHGLTLREAGVRVGVSESRALQIRNEALARARRLAIPGGPRARHRRTVA